MLVLYNAIEYYIYIESGVLSNNHVYILFVPTALAEIMKQLLTRYDNLFEVSFPYSMGWHGELYMYNTSSIKDQQGPNI